MSSSLEPLVHVSDDDETRVEEPPRSSKRRRLTRSVPLRGARSSATTAESEQSTGETTPTASFGPSTPDESTSIQQSPVASTSASDRVQSQTTTPRGSSRDASPQSEPPLEVNARTRISRRLTPQQIEFILSERAKEKFLRQHGRRLV